MRKMLGVVLLIVGVMGGSLLLMADPLHMRVPKDIDVLRDFQAHIATFERVRQMVIEDSSVASMFRANDLNRNLSQDRRDEYHRLFAELPKGIVVTTHRQSARFVFAIGGPSSIGPEWIKGIEYLPTAPADWGKTVDNLDDPAGLKTGNVYLRQAQSQWFLFLQKTD